MVLLPAHSGQTTRLAFCRAASSIAKHIRDTLASIESRLESCAVATLMVVATPPALPIMMLGSSTDEGDAIPSIEGSGGEIDRDASAHDKKARAYDRAGAGDGTYKNMFCQVDDHTAAVSEQLQVLPFRHGL